MTGRIKGITVEIGGDTSGLEKSLAAVNNSIKKTQSQLRDVNNLLKLDPSNTILLAQKQELLQSAIGDTEKKLEALEQAQEDVVRAGVVSIPVTFSMSAKWLKILTEFKQQEKITVGYFDMETLAVKTVEMYVEGYKASLVKDTSRKGLWPVSFTLREF
ncbi:hypothetical protein LKD70_18185 [Ruminococcus sp. CLA-AA-H200]|uniref:Phage protein n=1 Tax=Ruminococcus turbiniformis TaxID=2881258 RepID=A0ABS8G1W9_9FIRM|nr:hypothetical protein [Ruminococcus turbiniformis]MCC2256308.1 hypothetical protein [Ruminococcus turbiniformis]